MEYIIDCYTSDKKTILRRLRRLVKTVSAVDGGAYWQDVSLSQIHLNSNDTEKNLDKWLWKNNFNYIGVGPAEQ